MSQRHSISCRRPHPRYSRLSMTENCGSARHRNHSCASMILVLTSCRKGTDLDLLEETLEPELVVERHRFVQTRIDRCWSIATQGKRRRSTSSAGEGAYEIVNQAWTALKELSGPTRKVAIPTFLLCLCEKKLLAVLNLPVRGTQHPMRWRQFYQLASQISARSVRVQCCMWASPSSAADLHRNADGKFMPVSTHETLLAYLDAPAGKRANLVC